MTLGETHVPAKVYCRECRYFLDARRMTQQRCLHPHAHYWVDTSVERVPQYRTPDARNAHNDCPDFRSLRAWERLVRKDPTVVLVVGLLVLALVLTWRQFFL
jgi:hypothetical protein